jgi:hypothetical protein
MPKLITLSAAAVVLASSVPAAEAATQLGEYFNFSGFGTLGGVITDDNQAQYRREVQPKGAGENGSLLVDSNLGLQLTGKANNWLSASVQSLTAERTSPTLTTRIDWAFVKVTPTDDLSLRAGKLALPNFLVSDSRRIGYTNTALRPPNEVYSLDILNGGLTGGDASYNFHVAGNSLTVTGLAGKSSLTGTLPHKIDATNVRGLNAVWDGEWYTLRVGHITAKPQFTADLIPPGLVIDETYKFTGYGASLDRANVVLQAEYVQRRSAQFNSVIAANAWYVQGGYRIGSLLPYLSYAKLTPDGSSVAPQKTSAVGLRWDAFSSAAIKFQLEHVDTSDSAGASFITPTTPTPFGLVASPVTRPVTTVSVAVDFVF